MQTATMQTRSHALDLLFTDTQQHRVHDIFPYLDAPETLTSPSFLHRVTIFLTYGCNLSCPYCKTIARNDDDLQVFPQKAFAFSFHTFSELLAQLPTQRIAHLHFTGGEPTIINDLPKMVAFAKASGVQRCSLTSNGIAPLATYKKLVESGVDEIRISLDAADPETGAIMAGGRQRVWQRAVDNIRALALLREQRQDFFLLVNAVIADVNRKDMAQIVRFILELGVGDLRLLSVAAQKETLWDFPQASCVLQEIHDLLRAYPEASFPLLRRKLASVLVPEEIGLRGVQSPLGKSWRCYIPLTERTVDSTFYYPCSTYLREGGTPLGPLSDNSETQHQQTLQFVKEFSPLTDTICTTYCSHCTKEFNMLANQARE